MTASGTQKLPCQVRFIKTLTDPRRTASFGTSSPRATVIRGSEDGTKGSELMRHLIFKDRYYQLAECCHEKMLILCVFAAVRTDHFRATVSRL